MWTDLPCAVGTRVIALFGSSRQYAESLKQIVEALLRTGGARLATGKIHLRPRLKVVAKVRRGLVNDAIRLWLRTFVVATRVHKSTVAAAVQVSATTRTLIAPTNLFANPNRNRGPTAVTPKHNIRHNRLQLRPQPWATSRPYFQRSSPYYC
jgi:hypothetical protein